MKERTLVRLRRLIRLAIQGEATASEVSEVNAWLREAPDGEGRELVAMLDAARRRLAPRPAARSPWLGMAKIAAAIVIASGVALALIKVRPAPAVGQVYSAGSGQRLTMTLVDGTRVTLGPASEIRLAAHYGVSSRSLTLIGEGYFSVVHDPAHPFTVRANDVTTRDIGTVFDVRAYPEDAHASVVVVEGAVSIASSVCAPTRSCVATLTKGDLALVSDDGAHVVQHGANVSAMTAWLQGALVFDNTPLPVVLSDISRTFGVTIVLADSSLAKARVTARFSGQSLAFDLDAIMRAVDAQYERVDRRIVVRKAPVNTLDRSVSPRPPLTTALTTDRQE